MRPVHLPQKTGVTPQATLQKKTQDWVNSLPSRSLPPTDEDVIVLSESDDDNLPGQSDGLDDRPKPTNVKIKPVQICMGQTDGAGDDKTDDELSEPSKRKIKESDVQKGMLPTVKH